MSHWAWGRAWKIGTQRVVDERWEAQRQDGESTERTQETREESNHALAWKPGRGWRTGLSSRTKAQVAMSKKSHWTWGVGFWRPGGVWFGEYFKPGSCYL